MGIKMPIRRRSRRLRHRGGNPRPYNPAASDYGSVSPLIESLSFPNLDVSALKNRAGAGEGGLVDLGVGIPSSEDSNRGGLSEIRPGVPSQLGAGRKKVRTVKKRKITRKKKVTK